MSGRYGRNFRQRDQRDEDRINAMGDQAFARIQDLQEQITDMVNQASEVVEDIETWATDFGNEFTDNSRDTVMSELDRLTLLFRQRREDIEDQLEDYGRYLDDNAREWLEEQLDTLSDRVELFADEFDDRIGGVMGRNISGNISDDQSTEQTASVFMQALGRTEIGRTITTLASLSPAMIAIMGAIAAIAAVVSEINQSVQQARENTRDLAESFNETYADGQVRYQELLRELTDSGKQTQITATELEQTLADYGNRYAAQLSEREAVYLTMIAENTQQSVESYSKIIQRMKQQGATGDEVVARLRQLDALDRIGADTSAILNAITDYSNYVDTGTGEQMAAAESYIQDMIGLDISDINKAIATMNLDDLPDYIKMNSDLYDQIVQMTLGGQYDAQTVVDAVISGLTSMEGLNPYTAANAFGIYTNAFDTDRFSETPFSNYNAVNEDDTVRAGISDLQAISNSIENNVALFASPLAKWIENNPFIHNRNRLIGNKNTVESDEETGEPTKDFTDTTRVSAARAARSHRTGLSYVPYDEYNANLHEGERVLTAAEAKSQDEINDNLVSFIKQFSSAVQYLGRKIDDIQVQVTTEGQSRTSQTSRIRG